MCPGFAGRGFFCGRDVVPKRSFSSWAQTHDRRGDRFEMHPRAETRAACQRRATRGFRVSTREWTACLSRIHVERKEIFTSDFLRGPDALPVHDASRVALATVTLHRTALVAELRVPCELFSDLLDELEAGQLEQANGLSQLRRHRGAAVAVPSPAPSGAAGRKREARLRACGGRHRRSVSSHRRRSKRLALSALTSACYSSLVREGPGRFRGIANGGLYAFIAIGVFFVAMGLHARSQGYWSDRPMRPWWQILVGSVMIVYPTVELARRRRRGS